jgi:flavorubredoxin
LEVEQEMADAILSQYPYDLLMDEAAKYYANILWPFSQLIILRIQELQKRALKINMIAPSQRNNLA